MKSWVNNLLSPNLSYTMWRYIRKADRLTSYIKDNSVILPKKKPKKPTAYMAKSIWAIDIYIKELDKKLPNHLQDKYFAKQFVKKLMLDIAKQLYGQVMEFKIKINNMSEIDHADEVMNIAIGYNKRCDEVNAVIKDFIGPRVDLELNKQTPAWSK